MTLEKLRELAATHENTLREFRLSGDIANLYAFIEVVLAADTNIEDKITAFKNDITKSENAALYCIIQKIGERGNISIVKMLQSTPHSRPVYTNLLAKMEKHGIAKVINQGVKGTYIEFLCHIEDLL